MTTLETLRHRRLAMRVVTWVLMALVPLQAGLAGALGTAGPAHTHRSGGETLVLEDVRRVPTPEPEREIHVATAFGHFHAGGTARRHFHRVDDGSVVVVDDGGLAQAQASDGGGSGHGAAAADGLLPSSVAWFVPTSTQALPRHASWPWLTHEPEPFERPPRSA